MSRDLGRWQWVLRSITLAGLAAGLAMGCGGGGGTPAGAEGGHCFPNNTCNAGLTCASTLCVRLDAGGGGTGAAGTASGSGGASAGSSGAAAGSTGAAGTAGMSGSAGGDDGAAGSTATGGGSGTTDGGTDSTMGTDGFPASDVTLVNRATCPAGPFATPMPGTAQAVCTDAASQAALRYDTTSGPVWVASEGAFFFSCYPSTSTAGSTSGDIVKYTPGGGCEVVAPDVGTHGLTVAADGRLIGASFKTSSISEFNLATGRITVLVTGEPTMKIGTPLGVAMHSNGTIYFSNLQAGTGTLPAGVYQVNPSGTVSPLGTNVTLSYPSGLGGAMTLSPDEKTLFVISAGRFELAADGHVTGGNSGAIGSARMGGGIAVDCASNIYLSIANQTSGRILTFNEGALGTFPRGFDLAFGGPDGMSVLLVDQKSISVVPMNVPGVP